MKIEPLCIHCKHIKKHEGQLFCKAFPEGISHKQISEPKQVLEPCNNGIGFEQIDYDQEVFELPSKKSLNIGLTFEFDKKCCKKWLKIGLAVGAVALVVACMTSSKESENC